VVAACGASATQKKHALDFQSMYFVDSIDFSGFQAPLDFFQKVDNLAK